MTEDEAKVICFALARKTEIPKKSREAVMIILGTLCALEFEQRKLERNKHVE